MIAMDPAEVLGEVAHSDIERCSIEQRPIFMRGIELDQGGSFISDLFIQTGSLFNPSQKVTLRCVLVFFCKSIRLRVHSRLVM